MTIPSVVTGNASFIGDIQTNLKGTPVSTDNCLLRTLILTVADMWSAHNGGVWKSGDMRICMYTCTHALQGSWLQKH